MFIRSLPARGSAAVRRFFAAVRGLLARGSAAAGRLFASIRKLLSRRPVAIVAAIVVVVAVIGSGVAVANIAGSSATPTPEPTEIAQATATPSPTATLTPTASPTLAPSPTPSSSPSSSAAPMVAATTNGVWLPADQAALATRKPIAVMIDDQQGARPQSGLSMANIVYQGPAEGGIPRYMALFQTQSPPAIGPVRSTRLYFVAWAEEWRAGYVHMWGAPNAMARLAKDTGKYIYNMDGLHWGGKSGYMWRTGFRLAPHNLYTNYAKLYTLLVKLGGTAPLTTPNFVFGDDLPPSQRPVGSLISVPYDANHVTYAYDWKTNTYPRSVSFEGAQVDAATDLRIAPKNVILMFMNVGLLGGTPSALTKHRLDVQYVGHGNAMVFNNGLTIPAIWTKKSEYAPTVLTYSTGPNKGQQVVMARGQMFIQVIPTTIPASWVAGYSAPPETEPFAN